MVVNTDYKLPQPERFFGATYGREQHIHTRKRVILTLSLITLAAAVAFSFSPGWNPTLYETVITTQGGNALYCAANIISIIGTLIMAFGLADWLAYHNQELFEKEVAQGKHTYAKTVFRDWFNKRYDLNIASDEADWLLSGHNIWVHKQTDTGRTERVSIFFEWNSAFSTLAQYGRTGIHGNIDHTEWPFEGGIDGSKFTLLVKEEPAKPRTYRWQ